MEESDKKRIYAHQYYLAHKEQHIRNVKKYREDDPDGEKKKARKISSLKYNYHYNRSLKRAICLYAYMKSIDKKSLTLFVKDHPEFAAIIFECCNAQV